MHNLLQCSQPLSLLLPSGVGGPWASPQRTSLRTRVSLSFSWDPSISWRFSPNPVSWRTSGPCPEHPSSSIYTHKATLVRAHPSGHLPLPHAHYYTGHPEPWHGCTPQSLPRPHLPGLLTALLPKPFSGLAPAQPLPPVSLSIPGWVCLLTLTDEGQAAQAWPLLFSV